MTVDEKTRVSISQIEISVAVHSTENVDKVKKAVASLLPEPPSTSDFKVKLAKGHYGNPIRLLTLTISNSNRAYFIFKDLVSRLPEEMKKITVNTLVDRMDSKGNLYLRFDKQSAVFRVLKIRDDDPIRTRIRFEKKVDMPSLRQEILRVISNEELR